MTTNTTKMLFQESHLKHLLSKTSSSRSSTRRTSRSSSKSSRAWCTSSSRSSRSAKTTRSWWSSGATRSSRFLVLPRSESKSWRRSPDFPIFSRPVPHNLGVDCTTDTVSKFSIQFWQCIPVIHTCFRKITDSCCLDYVSDNELLDGFVFGTATRTVSAANVTDMTPPTFVTTSVSSFQSHGKVVSDLNISDYPM